MDTEKTCGIKGCTGTSVALGLCGTDYARFRRGRLPDYVPVRRHRGYAARTPGHATKCGYEPCDRPAESRGHCDAHAEQLRRGAPLTPIRVSRQERGCSVEGCPRPHEAHGLCTTHYAHALGRSQNRPSTRAPRIGTEGYVMVWVPGHPEAQKSGYALGHRMTMSDILNRPLLPDETVHHRNGVKTDNRPENLELWVSRHPKGQRVEDVVAWAKEILARYEPDALT